MTLSEKLRAAREAWAVGPVEARAFLRLSGKDAQDYLHRMSTQDLARLRPGQVAYTAFLNAKGHLLGEAHVLAREGDLLVELDPAAAPETRALLEKLVIMDEVELEDVSAALRVLKVEWRRPISRAAETVTVFGLLAAARLMGRLRTKRMRTAPDRFCFNHIVTTDGLSIRHRSLFTAHALAWLVPVYDPWGYAARLQQANEWTSGFTSTHGCHDFVHRSVRHSRFLSGVRRTIELVLNTFIGLGELIVIKDRSH